MTDLRGELLAIRKKRGFLDPDVVVEEARPENHPLHSRFDWDDAIAGPKWRREQARHMLKSVKVKYREPDPTDEQDRGVEGRAFYAVPHQHESHVEYVWEPVEAIVADPLTMKLVLREMERDIKELRVRYGHLKEYREMLRAELEAVAA